MCSWFINQSERRVESSFHASSQYLMVSRYVTVRVFKPLSYILETNFSEKEIAKTRNTRLHEAKQMYVTEITTVYCFKGMCVS